MAEFKNFHLYLGTFEKDKFIWKKLESFSTFDAAYNRYIKFIKEQLDYGNEELLKIWKSARLDIELKQGDKRINWCGLTCRQSEELDEDEDEEDKLEHSDTEE